MRMRRTSLTRDCVNRLDVVGSGGVEELVRLRHHLILADTRLEDLRNKLVGAVNNCRRAREQHDLISRLDLASIEHDLLPISYIDASSHQCEHHRHLNDIDTDRGIRHPSILE